MISYTKRYVNIVSLAITILVYIFLIRTNLLPQKNDFEKPLKLFNHNVGYLTDGKYINMKNFFTETIRNRRT